MKIRVKRSFKYTFDQVNTHELLPGEYEVGRQVDKDAAMLAIQFCAAVIIPESEKVKEKPVFSKKAPENKVKKVKETK